MRAVAALQRCNAAELSSGAFVQRCRIWGGVSDFKHRSLQCYRSCLNVPGWSGQVFGADARGPPRQAQNPSDRTAADIRDLTACRTSPAPMAHAGQTCGSAFTRDGTLVCDRGRRKASCAGRRRRSGWGEGADLSDCSTRDAPLSALRRERKSPVPTSAASETAQESQQRSN